MAKAKKPAPTGGTPTDKTAGGTTNNTGSVPKTTRTKPPESAKPTVKAPVPEKAAAETPKVTTSATVSEPVKPNAPDTAKSSVKADAKPTEAKSAEKPDTPDSKAPEPQKVETKPAPELQKSSSIFWPLVIGGALAAAIGFLAAEVNVLGTRSDTSELRVTLQDQQAQIAALENAEPQTPEIEMPDLAPLTDEITTLGETLSAIDARLSEVEKRPITGNESSSAAVAAYERELEALQASVQKQRTEIEGLLDNALSVEEATIDAARNATLQAALTRVTAAISTGQPFAEPLADLEANGMSDLPAALTDTAENGVVTMANLQTRFPDTARAVLSAVRASGTDAGAGGVGGFLKRQLGARSVAPREGTDPDAVLSRAEAAVRDGRLTDALAELDTLPEISQSDLDAWLSDARARQASEAAVQDLSQRLTAN